MCSGCEEMAESHAPKALMGLGSERWGGGSQQRESLECNDKDTSSTHQEEPFNVFVQPQDTVRCVLHKCLWELLWGEAGVWTADSRDVLWSVDQDGR